MNLRSLLADSRYQHEILSETWESILSWMKPGGTGTGLTVEEELRLHAMLMSIKGDKEWFDPNENGGYVLSKE